MSRYAHSYPPGELIGGQYRIIKRFEGGISEVYQCRDEATDKFLALKTLKPHFIDDMEHRKRFFEQTEVWIKLGKHPNIVWCMRLEMLDQQIPFMFLEWVSSERGRHPDLRGWMRGGKLSLRQVLDILLDICTGMIYANQLYRRDLNADLVHLDIKPDNVLIAPGQVAKITDFGMARVINAEARERTLVGKGTAAYMAPEQWTPGTPMSIRTDVYSFGCMFYEMLTERQPFQGSVYQLGQQHINDEPDFSTLPETVIDIVRRAMQKRPEDRFASFEEVHAALHSVYISMFATEPVTRPVQQDYTAQDLGNRAGTYMRLGNYESALIDIDAALVKEPNDSYLVASKGMVFSALNRHEEAIQWLQRAAQEVPNNAQIQFFLGTAYQQSRDYVNALDRLDRAITLDETHLAARYQRALMLAALERIDEAIRDFTHTIRQRNDIGEFYLYRGTLYRMKKEYVLAINDLTHAIQVNDGLLEAYLERANVYLYHLRRRAEAIEDLRRYLDINPDEPEAYAVLGRIYAEVEQYDEALRNFNLCLQLNPNQPLIYCERGHVYSEMRDYEKALKDFDTAEEMAPKLSSPHSLRGITLSRLGRHKEALESFALASTLDPADLTHVRGRTVVFAETERYEMGLTEITKLIIAAPDEKWAYYVRSYFYRQTERFQEASEDLERALKIDPNFQHARIARGRLALHLEQYDAALSDFEAVRQRNLYNYNALVGIGEYHEKLGNQTLAMMFYKQAAQLGSPEGGIAYNTLAAQMSVPKLSFDPLMMVLSEFMNASSPGDLQQAVRRHPYMTDAQFVSIVQEAIIVTRDPRRIPLIRRNLQALKLLSRHFQDM